ncbi:unnamed protein product [Cochlearia groenlandica]
MERLKTKFAIDTPPIFERQCREKEGRLERWLEDRPQLYYDASDFELPAELEVNSLLEFLDEEMADGVEETQGGAGDERAEDATLAEEGEAAERGE